MTLRSEILQWDTKSVTQISRVYIKHYESASFIDDLIGMMSDASLETGTTWLFNHVIDEGDLVGGSLNQSQLIELFDSVNSFTHWGAQLHILQCLAHPSADPNRVGTEH